jgi:zinc/manganese transport system substrate-binding protein
MKRYIATLLLAAAALIGATPAYAKLNILSCEPEWAALAREIGGDRVNVSSATTAMQDPHRIEARPSLIARARNADLMVCTGAELEVGWMPLLLSQGGNSKIQVGQPGYFEAAAHASVIEVPSRVDRSMGDVHPAGNPHLHLDPGNIAKVATALSERMAQLDSGQATYYRERTKAFLERWQQATVRWEKQAAPLKGVPVVVYHKDNAYLIKWLGMREVGALEPKPGLPPTTAHLSELLAQLARNPARLVIRSAYNDPRPAEFLAERAKIPAVLLPYTVGGTDQAKDLFGLYEDTVTRLLAATK